mgnify:FL=1
MGIWIGDAREFEELREENERLKQRVAHLERLLNASGEAIDLALSPSERALVLDGRKLEAVKAYRDRTGVGLKTAKEAVDAVQ